MTLLDRLNRKFGRFGIPNLTLFLIIGQILLYVVNNLPAGQGQAPTLESIRLEPDMVMQGEVWRLITYLFDPPGMNVIFAFFFWYLFYLMGTTLETVWGTFRYNVFLGIGYIASVAMAFLSWYQFPQPGAAATNLFLETTVFLAFARLYPDFTLMLFFVLPVKIRWLALLTWIGLGYGLLFAPDWMSRLMIVAAVSNYLVFFGRDIWLDVKHGHRRMQFRAKALKSRSQIMHECRVCGLNNKTAPLVQFRYCTKCDGDCCYCPEHLSNHEHIAAAGEKTGAA
jgi:hypothetical protein